MSFTLYQVFVLSAFTISGTITTLCLKYNDKQKARYRDGNEYNFNHPFFQAACTFLAMALCYIPYVISICLKKRQNESRNQVDSNNGIEISTETSSRNYSTFLFLPPGILYLFANSIAYFGLNLTYASSYQMLIGSTMIFTGLLSVGFLNNNMTLSKWSGIFIICVGLVLVGLCDYIYTKNVVFLDTNGIITGDLLVVISRIVFAFQLIYEEKYLKKHNISPLEVVSWEGIFGFIIISVLFIPLYYIKIPLFSKTDPEYRLENIIDALYQLYDNVYILATVIINIIASIFFNYYAMCCTKEFSSTTRVVFANLRTISVWIVSLALKWETFHKLELFGLIFIIFGTCVYNNLTHIFIEKLKKLRSVQSNSFEEPNETTQLVQNDTNQ